MRKLLLIVILFSCGCVDKPGCDRAIIELYPKSDIIHVISDDDYSAYIVDGEHYMCIHRLLANIRRNNQVDISKSGWAYDISQADLSDVKECDAILAVVNGTPPDEGVMIELGYAMALGKKIFLFRDDFRRCSDSEMYPLNLMVFGSLPKEGWEEYFYTKESQLCDKEKALYRWAKVER